MSIATDLFGELKRRKVIRVAVAYAIAGWLVVQVAETVFEPLLLPDWALTLVVILVILGFPVAVALAWAFELTPGGVKRDSVKEEKAPEATREDAAQPAPAPTASVAVLPFVDMSPEQDQSYFCDGVAEEILNSLVHVSGLSVASRTSSFQFRGYAGDISDIGRRLGVAAILEGSVRKSGDRLRVTSQLIATENGFHLWSDRFDVEAADVFAVQEQIASSIAGALRVSLKPEDRRHMQRGTTTNLEAYDYYLRGLSYFHSFSWRTMEYARQMFLKAIEIDAGYGRAWAGLAYAAGYIYLYRDKDSKYVEEAYEASAKAIECGDTAEGHAARGVALGLTKDYDASTAEFERALAMNPDHYEALWLFGRFAHESGDYARAAELWERATAVNNDDYQAALLLPQVFLSLGQPRKAREWQERGLARALRHLELHPDDGVVLYNIACMHAMLGEKDQAIDLLERGSRHGSYNAAWMEHDSTLEPLKGDPRFEAILERSRQDSSPSSRGD